MGTETKDPSKLPKISVNMNVLARRKCREWQQGKILDIVTKGKEKIEIGDEESVYLILFSYLFHTYSF